MYKVPTPSELREFLAAHRLTGSAAGKLVGVDSRVIRRWTAPEDQPGSRGMPWAAWALLRLMVGELSVEGARQEAEKAGSESRPRPAAM